MLIFSHEGKFKALLRKVDDFGFESYDLVGMPRRIADAKENLVDFAVDVRRVKKVCSPAEWIENRKLPENENWLKVSQRSVARLLASFLIAEDPQRRLDARKAATLMHQVSLVQHILSKNDLRRVLIGDEVGLGKTIEAGLLISQLISSDTSLRVLYLAPARLVKNVVSEFREKLDIDARQWVAGASSDARVNQDRVVIASINKSVYGSNGEALLNGDPWNVIVVDECHHLSDWNPSGGRPNQSFRLVSKLASGLSSDGRLILLSGTPHQGSEARFRNLLRLLSDDGRDIEGAKGRVIFRTKDRVRDWQGAPLFPQREIRKPVVVSLGDAYQDWYQEVGRLYEGAGVNGVRLRAAGWAKGQALQWAASSVHAGLGFLVRLAMRRLNWNLENVELKLALRVLRPYRGGSRDEPLPQLFDRIQRQIGTSPLGSGDSEDQDFWEEESWYPDPQRLSKLILGAVELIKNGASDVKWEAVADLIDRSEGEKVVLFAQPVETVTVVAEFLAKRYGEQPALIVGNQSDDARNQQVARFQQDDGPRFMVSSRAGGEGLNMQKARRLIHLDVPWNPMDLEQRIGRVHRFGSRKKVIIDTVVAAGSREIDMYRIAREKLVMIAQHLDPDQFEALFSRVMSLVPPKELEGILSSTSMGDFVSESAAEIGRLVTAGYTSWSDFDKEYRARAEEIRAANPGEAKWSDLLLFLTKYGQGRNEDLAIFGTFKFEADEVIAVDSEVDAVRIGEEIYACGDTAGAIAKTKSGAVAKQLGLNTDRVRSMLRSSFSPVNLNMPIGPAFFKRGQDVSWYPKLPFVVFFYIRQKIKKENENWEEKTLQLKGYLQISDGTLTALNASQGATVVRDLCTLVRVRDPIDDKFPVDLVQAELNIANELRKPSEEEISQGIRYAVWPIFAAFL